METFISRCENDTLEFAKKFAKSLKKDSVVVLDGELGAGKTKFTQGVLEFFGLGDEISSPTFTIVNEYRNDMASIFHFDVYRLSDVDEFFAIGGEEYFGKGICIIEWGEIIREALPPDCIFVRFEKDNDDVNIRRIIVEC